MKKLTVIIIVLLIISSVMSSCSSIYVDAPKPAMTGAVEVDLDGEYFTDGRLYTQHKAYDGDGYTYDGAWYFIDSQEYFVKSVTYDEQGNKHISTGNRFCNRIVKLNAATGQITSPCLDPVCTHGPGSGCPLMELEGYNMAFLMVADDWIIMEQSPDEAAELVYLRQVHGYNIKTGKTVQLYKESFEADVLTDYDLSLSVYDGKFYLVKHELDYSKTSFDANGSKPLSDYEPETKSYLYEYDLDKNKTKELFEIPAGASVVRMTNKRFMLRIDDEYYTCDLDGSNLQKSDGLEFFPIHKVGTFAFAYIENGFEYYDLKTNQSKEVLIEEFKFTANKNTSFTEKGLFFFVCTSDDAYLDAVKAFGKFRTEHKGMPDDEIIELYNKTYGSVQSVRYGGKSQIWRCNYDGSNMELLYELDNSIVRFVGINDKYAYAIVSIADPENDYQIIPEFESRQCVIDFESGEITPLPLLELILPENAYYTQEEMRDSMK